jgi:hypothetical protein
MPQNPGWRRYPREWGIRRRTEMANEITLAEWPNSSGNVVRVRLGKYRGNLRLDIREWYRRDEKLCPGRKGISIDPRRLRKLGKAVRRARVIVKKAKT